MSSVPPQAAALWSQGSFSVTAIDEKACCPRRQGGTIRWGGVSLEWLQAPSASMQDRLWGNEADTEKATLRGGERDSEHSWHGFQAHEPTIAISS